MDDNGRHILQCSTNDLQEFFNTKVWQVDMMGLFRSELEMLRDEASAPGGPEGTDLARLRGRVEQVIVFLETEEYVLGEKKEQLEEKKEDG